jgi:LacI family transcriptional regulator
MIRLKDVAARAGVSLMTVSKVLRDAPDVSPATKANIRRLVEEMGYVPDALARGLRTRHTRLLGVVLPSVTHPLLGRVILALEDRAHELGYDLLLAQTQDHPQREEACLRRLLARRVDGLFIYPVYRLAPTAPTYEELAKSGTPTVLLGQAAAFCGAFPSVVADHALASYQMTRHLIGLGHQRIAFFAGPPAAPWAQEHFDGYRRALRESALAMDDRLVFSAGPALEDGRKAALEMIGEFTDATAIQTVSDLAALGAATVLWKEGFTIPKSISLTGYGDHLAAEYLRVPLTTVHPPKHAIGLAAMDAMQRLLAGHAIESQRLPGNLIVRASTAAPARTSPLRGDPLHQPGAAFAQGDDLP